MLALPALRPLRLRRIPRREEGQMVNLRINDRPVTVEDGTSILHAARQLGITIPSLCYLKHVSKVAACRVCMVEIKGTDRLMAACDTICAEGMEVYTNTLRALVARRNNVQLILSQHDCNCATCVRSGNCTLQKLAADMNIIENPYETKLPANNWNPKLPVIRTASKCVQCFRCIAVCENRQPRHRRRARRQKARRGELRLLRAVHHSLSDRRSPRAGRYRKGHLRDRRSEKGRRAAGRSGGARRVGRGAGPSQGACHRRTYGGGVPRRGRQLCL